jgi:hypothetical protein
MSLIFRALLIGAVVVKDNWPEVKDFLKRNMGFGKSKSLKRST